MENKKGDKLLGMVHGCINIVKEKEGFYEAGTPDQLVSHPIKIYYITFLFLKF